MVLLPTALQGEIITFQKNQDETEMKEKETTMKMMMVWEPVQAGLWYWGGVTESASR